tara:strand:- start:1424 stop:2011 length:588 start_codon:yes stop_codon:yes gene_type:complete
MRDFSDEYMGPCPELLETGSDDDDDAGHKPRKRRTRQSKQQLLALELSPIEVMLDEPIQKADGAALSIDDALMYKTVQDALAGKRTAIKEVIHALIEREELRVELRAKHIKPAPLQIVVETEPFNAYRAMDVLGIILRVEEPGYDYLLNRLDSWVIEAAMARRRTAGALSDTEMNAVRSAAIDPKLPVIEAEYDD